MAGFLDHLRTFEERCRKFWTKNPKCKYLRAVKTSTGCQKQQRGPSCLIRQYPINSLYLSVDAVSEITTSVIFNFTAGAFSVQAITINDAALFLLKWTQLIY